MAENLSKETFLPTKNKRTRDQCENHLSKLVEDASYEDYICPICLQLLIEPVVMPCKHELCKICFTQNVQEANLQCPICRVRISSWARRQARNGTLICQQRWEIIQNLFPMKCERRLRGTDDDGDREDFYCHRPLKRILSENGEIRSEYEEEMRKIRFDREEECKASEEFIHILMEEENNVSSEMEQLREKDEEIARKIHQQQINETQVATPYKSQINSLSVCKAKMSKIYNSPTLERWFSPSSKLKSTAVHKSDPSESTRSQSRTTDPSQEHSKEKSNMDKDHDQTCLESDLNHKQQQDDFALALRLQQQFDKERRQEQQVVRKKGTVDGYMLRKDSHTCTSTNTFS